MQFNTHHQPASAQSSLSLRQRCGIKFRLALTPPYFKSNGPTYDSIPRRRKRSAPAAIAACQPAAQPPLSPTSDTTPSKPGKLGSHLKNFLLGRHQETFKEIARHVEQLAPTDLDDILATPFTPRFAERHEARCLQQIIPGLYVAFEDDNAACPELSWKEWCSRNPFDSMADSTSDDLTLEDSTLLSKDPIQEAVFDPEAPLATPHGRDWTHIVSICNHISDKHNESAETLQLVLPSASDVLAEDEDAKCSILTEDQLVAARDFLSFHGHSLSSSRASSPSTESSSSLSYSSSSSTLAEEDEPVRLLITAPRNRRADALSVALCFLAFTFNCPVEAFLDELQARKGCIPVWKNVLDEAGVAAISSAAVRPNF